MAYSQKPLLEEMKKGNIPGEKNKPDHIGTVISNVFLFPKKVYKLYKNDNTFFNQGFRDISSRKARFAFVKKDFAWNRTLSPTIYQKITGVRIKEGRIAFVSEAEAQELFIVMKRVNTRNVLLEKLIRGEIGQKEAMIIGRDLGKQLLTARKSSPPSASLPQIFRKRIPDLENWLRASEAFVPRAERERYILYFKTFLQTHKRLFKGRWSHEIAWDGDVHSANALYLNNHFFLIDSYQPKESWLFMHRDLAAYRIGADLWALTAKKEIYKSFLKGYESGNKQKINKELENVFLLYGGGVMLGNLYMMARMDPSKKSAARRYHAFLRTYFKRVKSA